MPCHSGVSSLERVQTGSLPMIASGKAAHVFHVPEAIYFDIFTLAGLTNSFLPSLLAQTRGYGDSDASLGAWENLKLYLWFLNGSWCSSRCLCRSRCCTPAGVSGPGTKLSLHCLRLYNKRHKKMGALSSRASLCVQLVGEQLGL